MKRCQECKDGEHENYDDIIHTTIIAENHKTIKCEHMCDEHRQMYDDDGYEVIIVAD